MSDTGENKRLIEEIFTPQSIEYHELEQRGMDLVCVSCPYRHGQKGYFKPGEVLTKDTSGSYKKISIEEDMQIRTA